MANRSPAFSGSGFLRMHLSVVNSLYGCSKRSSPSNSARLVETFYLFWYTLICAHIKQVAVERSCAIVRRGFEEDSIQKKRERTPGRVGDPGVFFAKFKAGSVLLSQKVTKLVPLIYFHSKPGYQLKQLFKQNSQSMIPLHALAECIRSFCSTSVHFRIINCPVLDPAGVEKRMK